MDFRKKKVLTTQTIITSDKNYQSTKKLASLNVTYQSTELLKTPEVKHNKAQREINVQLELRISIPQYYQIGFFGRKLEKIQD